MYVCPIYFRIIFVIDLLVLIHVCARLLYHTRYVFPGIGLGAIISEAKNISDAMIEASAIALSECLDEEEKADGLLYPRLNR